MKKELFICLALFGMLLFGQPAVAQITIDGLFFDWEAATQVDVAPQAEELTFDLGDPDCPNPAVPSYFADLDIEDLFITDDADLVYFRIKMNPVANLANVPNDTSYHGGASVAVYISVDPGWSDITGLTWGWWGSGYDFFVQVYPADSTAVASTDGYDQYIWEHKQAGNGWDFIPADSTIGSKVAWNASNNEVEFSVPKQLLLNPKYIPNFVRPDTIAVMVYAGENLAPWRADYASNPGVAGFKFALGGSTGVATRPAGRIPVSMTLEQNYPNPFNPETRVRFALPAQGNVRIRVFDLLGKQVASMADGVFSAGEHTVTFSGQDLPSGVYFYVLEASGSRAIRKMTLIK